MCSAPSAICPPTMGSALNFFSFLVTIVRLILSHCLPNLALFFRPGLTWALHRVLQLSLSNSASRHSLRHSPVGESNEVGYVYADGLLAATLNPSQLASTYTTQSCGLSSISESFFTYFVDLPQHTASTVTLRFTTNLNECRFFQ